MDSIQKQALQVDFPDENFNPDVEPEDGFEYLKKVIYERNNCPAVMVCDVLSQKNSNIQSENEHTKDTVTASNFRRLVPTKEWQNLQSNRFTELRNQISKIRNLKNSQTLETAEETSETVYEEENWIEFCRSHAPLLNYLLEIPDRQIEIVLEYLYQSLQEECSKKTVNFYSKESWITEWIYGLLAILHTPVEPYVHSLLRDIARICITLRNEMDDTTNEKEATPLNLLICIISINFNQLDLCDNY